MTIYALTLTWNGKKYLEQLYPSLQKASKYVDLKWYIRDNNSSDGTEEYLKKCDCVYYKASNNLLNFSQGNNYLLNNIKFNNDDYVLLLNNDIIFKEPQSIKYMLDIMDDKEVGIVGAKLFYPNKKIQHFGVAMSPRHGNMPWHVYSGQNDSQFTKYNKTFQAVTGACMLIRYECISNLKNSKLNENYNWSFEDIDLCLQASKNQNKKIVCCANTNIIHNESVSLMKNPINKMFMSNNVNVFLSNWGNKYQLDYDEYMSNPKYNLYE